MILNRIKTDEAFSFFPLSSKIFHLKFLHMFLAILNDVVSMDIIWLGVAALAYILKMITKHYVFACIAVAALICAFCVFAEIEMRPLWELVIFVVATIALSFFIQPYVLRKKLEETEVVRKIPDFPQKNKEGGQSLC